MQTLLTCTLFNVHRNSAVEGAYFVGRKEILDWVNSACSLNLAKVEDTASGCAACMLLDQLHPGVINMSKVNWNAKQSFEFVGNYKLLQTAFTKLKIDRHVDVDRLISGRAMDNLEFMQWFKRFYELANGGSLNCPAGYDPLEVRSRGKGGKEFKASSVIKRTGSAPDVSGASESRGASAADKKPDELPKLPRRGSASAVGEKDSDEKKEKAVRVPKDAAAKEAARTKTKPAGAAIRKEAPGSPGAAARLSSSAALVANKALLAEVQSLKAENETIRGEMVGLEKERDFYFDKLRDIEILLQDLEEEGGLKEPSTADVSAKIFKILYQTAEGFVQSPSVANAASAAQATNRNNTDSPISPMRYDAQNAADSGQEDEEH